MDNLEQYFRVYALIDIDAVRKNVKNLMAKTKKGTRAIAVIKTDAYGHGATEIAQNISDLVDGFAVATINEALVLRKNGIQKDIIILGYTNEYYYKDLIEQQIRPAMYTYDMIKKISDVAVSLNKEAVIHIKVDTGMGRIGFRDNEESIEEIVRAAKLPNIRMEGIFTHFAKADEKDKTSASEQLERYLKFLLKLEERGVTIPIHHCSNSAGIIDMPQANCDEVRMGISLYGMYPSDEVEKEQVTLYPVLSLHSHVVHVKEIQPGESVGYGGTFTAEKKTKVATVPVGYGDGYFRNLSNKASVIIHGVKVPIIGRICMDQFMVDVTNIPDVKIGDAVTLIGKDGKEEITVDELADIAGTINYEIVCDLGKRIPRVFLRDGKIISTRDYFDK